MTAPRRTPPAQVKSAAVPDTDRSDRESSVLLADPDPTLFESLAKALRQERVTLTHVHDANEARQALARFRFDALLLDESLCMGADAGAAMQLMSVCPATPTLLLATVRGVPEAVEALRAGVSDLLVKPVSPTEAVSRLREALRRGHESRRTERRLQRLQRVCRKLNRARLQVSRQVDILCNDLVRAYQELADQMQVVAQSSEFAGLVAGELDLELLLRKTLEHLLEKAGPTNAAIFLPAHHDEYTVGAYVNYDTASDASQLLLDHMADVLAPQVSRQQGVVHLTDPKSFEQWLGEDSAYLASAHLLAFAAHADDEPLAVLALFRDGSEPFTPQAAATCAAVAPLLAQALAKIVRVHHRHLADPTDDDDRDGDESAAA